MKTTLLTALVIISTLMTSQPIMAVLEEVIVPPGYHMIAASPVELRSEVIGFSLALGACISLVVGVAGYTHAYSLQVRLMFVLLPILFGSIVSGFFLSDQVMQATTLTMEGSLARAIALKDVNLDKIPWAGFFTGLLAVGMMIWVGRRQANSDTPSSDPTAD